MYLPKNVVKDVGDIARIHYINGAMCQAWNSQRHADELRLLSGWCWQSKVDGKYQMGLKTYSAAVRDCYYRMIAKQAAPGVRTRLRRVV